MGIPIIVCEYSNLWVAGSEGYLIYHQFYPGGPKAEDAWWYGELGNKAHNCVDYAGTNVKASITLRSTEIFCGTFHMESTRRTQRRCWKASKTKQERNDFWQGEPKRASN